MKTAGALQNWTLSVFLGQFEWHLIGLQRQSPDYLDLEMRANKSALQSSSEEKYNQDNQHNAADADTAVWSVGVIAAASAEEQEREEQHAGSPEGLRLPPLGRHSIAQRPNQNNLKPQTATETATAKMSLASRFSPRPDSPGTVVEARVRCGAEPGKGAAPHTGQK